MFPFLYEPAAVCPQAEAWIGDEKHFFTVDSVIPLRHGLWIVTPKHGG
jgi:hypothetical protein